MTLTLLILFIIISFLGVTNSMSARWESFSEVPIFTIVFLNFLMGEYVFGPGSLEDDLIASSKNVFLLPPLSTPRGPFHCRVLLYLQGSGFDSDSFMILSM
eukprot:CAMPEP_0168347802 /NCGR_PEP_ID=MMETSP0213-20121227/19265_1 /TAXON_ID=151035 /ORGANISM="Euplotes harpa, Strain FSP1.4" /LENGTH=100 /DNA_ID=CAMNT_0008357077 /DNA_START=280 /DNA_END=582 /DNA_ORIENTATION=+